MICAACGAEIDTGVVVCVHCGSALEPSQAVEPPQTLVLPRAALPPVAVAPVTVPHSAVPPASAGAGPPPLFTTTLLDADRHLEGLSGWLILIGIGLVVSPFILLTTVIAINIPLLTTPKYRPYLESHPAVGALILSEIGVTLCVVALLGALNYLFFKKKRSFPTYMILYLLLNVAIVASDVAATHIIMPTATSPQTAGAIARTVLSAAIWIPYFVVSRRVKVTFVN